MSIEQLRERFIAYIDQSYNTPRERNRVLLGGALALLGVTILALCALLGVWQAGGLGVILTAVGSHRLYYALRPLRWYRRMREVAIRGVPVTAYVVQANSVLHVPGDRASFALVVFTFDPPGGDPRFMVPIIPQLQSLKGTTPTDQETADPAKRITSEKAEFHHREKLPRSLTEAADVYMGDLMIVPTRLKERYLDRPALLCLAEPGDRGGIEQVPDWLLGEARRSNEQRESEAQQTSPLSRN